MFFLATHQAVLLQKKYRLLLSNDIFFELIMP